MALLRLFDFECADCDVVFEALLDVSTNVHTYNQWPSCPLCDGKNTEKIIGVSTVYVGNQDANWLKSVSEVVDKAPWKPHCVEFLKNPTRANHRAWMKGEGLRMMEDGEQHQRKKPEINEEKIMKEVWDKYRKRNTITL